MDNNKINKNAEEYSGNHSLNNNLNTDYSDNNNLNKDYSGNLSLNNNISEEEEEELLDSLVRILLTLTRILFRVSSSRVCSICSRLKDL